MLKTVAIETVVLMKEVWHHLGWRSPTTCQINLSTEALHRWRPACLTGTVAGTIMPGSHAARGTIRMQLSAVIATLFMVHHEVASWLGSLLHL